MTTVDLVNEYFTREARRAIERGERPGPLSVLLIDDDPDFNKMVESALKKEGVEVDIAKDGKEGHWKSFTRDYSIILLDLKMTGMDGAEVLAKIKKDKPDARVVLCTGYAQTEILKRAMEHGPFGVVEKPEDVFKLMDVFRHYNLTRSARPEK